MNDKLENIPFLNFNYNVFSSSEICVKDLVANNFRNFLRDYLIRGFIRKQEFEDDITTNEPLYPLFNFDKVDFKDFKKFNYYGLLSFLRDSPYSHDHFDKSVNEIETLLKSSKEAEFYLLDSDDFNNEYFKFNENWYWFYFLIFWIQDENIHIIEFYGD